MTRTIGVPELPEPLDLINEAGEYLVTVHPWKWLERQEIRVNVYKGIPYVRLPLRFPRSFRDIIALQPAGLTLETIGWSTFGTLLERRNYGLDIPLTRRVALTHLPAQHPNLLFETENVASATVGGPVWARTGTDPITVASGASDPAHPVTGEKTTTRIQGDTADFLLQAVAAHRLVNGGVYRASWLVRGDQAALPTRSTITLTTSSGTVRTAVDITWATLAVALSPGLANAGAGVHTFGSERLSNGWVRVWVDLTYLTTADTGALASRIHCVGATLVELDKAIFVADPQVELVVPAASSTVLPVSPSTYEPVPYAEEIRGGEPIPVLEMHPVPAADDLSGPISIIYRGGWPQVESERDLISIPSYLHSYFRELLVAWARGTLEEDVASLSDRITGQLGLASGNEFLRAAMERDWEVQPEYGVLRGGAAEGAPLYIDYGSDATVADPS